MEKTKKLVIVGSGETGLIAYEYFQFDSNYDVDAFSVNEEYITETTINDLPVVPFERLEEKYNPNEYEVYVAISSGKLNRNRTKVYNEAKIKGYKCASYVSSKAFVWRNVEIGENCFISSHCVISGFCEVGENSFLGVNCTIENNVKIAKDNFIGAGSLIQKDTIEKGLYQTSQT